MWLFLCSPFFQPTCLQNLRFDLCFFVCLFQSHYTWKREPSRMPSSYGGWYTFHVKYATRLGILKIVFFLFTLPGFTDSGNLNFRISVGKIELLEIDVYFPDIFSNFTFILQKWYVCDKFHSLTKYMHALFPFFLN